MSICIMCKCFVLYLCQKTDKLLNEGAIRSDNDAMLLNVYLASAILKDIGLCSRNE